MDQSRGPTDKFGTHVLQVAVFDTRTGEQLYRTPGEPPEKGDDLAALYPEVMPLLHGVSEDRVFFDGATILLDDGSRIPAGADADGLELYEGYAETLFPDGYRVGIRGAGRRRVLAEPPMYAVGRLSPDRSTILDVSQWPSPAVAYDARTGRPRPIQAPWGHFTLGGWLGADTFFGVAERIEQTRADNVLVARQVVSCAVATLACEAVSPVIPGPPDGQTDGSAEAEGAAFLLEGSRP